MHARKPTSAISAESARVKTEAEQSAAQSVERVREEMEQRAVDSAARVREEMEQRALESATRVREEMEQRSARIRDARARGDGTTRGRVRGARP